MLDEKMINKLFEEASKGEQLSEEDKIELQGRLEVLQTKEEELKVELQTIRQEIKEVESNLDVERRIEQKAMKKIAELAEILGVDPETLGLNKVIKKQSKGLRKSTFTINGIPSSNSDKGISRVLWYATRGFGFTNSNGSISKDDFVMIVNDQADQAWDNGNNFEVEVISIDGEKRVKIGRILPEAEAEEAEAEEAERIEADTQEAMQASAQEADH